MPIIKWIEFNDNAQENMMCESITSAPDSYWGSWCKGRVTCEDCAMYVHTYKGLDAFKQFYKIRIEE